MADLTGNEAAIATKIVGQDSSGVETNPVNSDASGNLHTRLFARRTPAGDILDLTTDAAGNLRVTTVIDPNSAAFSFGQITTAALTEVVVRSTPYTEPTAQAQRSVSSSVAADTAAGTGARQVRITYLDNLGNGPFTETVTLNGTTPVNTVATNIRFIEKMEVVSVGSGGSNAGVITLFNGLAGAGGAIGTIAVNQNNTAWAHHYVPVGKAANITGLSCGHNGTVVGSGALFRIFAQALNDGQPDRQISDFVRLYGQSSTFSRIYQSPIRVFGPARVTVRVTPESTSALIYRTAFDFFQSTL
jgi:hypothetical protein